MSSLVYSPNVVSPSRPSYSTMLRSELVLVGLAVQVVLASARAPLPIPEEFTSTARLSVEQYNLLQRQWCESGNRLVCKFNPTTNSSVSGTVMFAPVWVQDKSECHTEVKAHVTGMIKNTMQAMHIHEWGDTTSPDGKSCGGHFSSPSMRKTKHGMPTDKLRHWGDLGSLKSDEFGNAMYYRVDEIITINGIVGRGMIIHRDMDKGVASQPSGGAGPRKAMCVIGYANPATKMDA